MGGLVGVQDEAGEGAVLVVVSPVGFASVQFDVDLVSGVQVQHGTVAGVVVVLVCVLSDGTGPDLERQEGTRPPGMSFTEIEAELESSWMPQGQGEGSSSGAKVAFVVWKENIGS